tara:strand:+ start:4025 stop:4213 length:189 start_codon:yes stop_codon:yes gene_type:complete
MKTCSKCKKTKEVSEYNFQRGKPRTSCRQCAADKWLEKYGIARHAISTLDMMINKLLAKAWV